MVLTPTTCSGKQKKDKIEKTNALWRQGQGTGYQRHDHRHTHWMEGLPGVGGVACCSTEVVFACLAADIISPISIPLGNHELTIERSLHRID